jgi:hypothetical protein
VVLGIAAMHEEGGKLFVLCSYRDESLLILER